MSGLIRVHDLVDQGNDGRAIRRSAAHGDLKYIERGQYLPTREWNELDADTQYRLRIHAFAEAARTTQVFSHWSALALWGYPTITRWPSAVHVTLGLGNGQRSSNRVARHISDLPDDDVVEHDGLYVTSPVRTLVDLARIAPFANGVAAIDRALARVGTNLGTAPPVERGELIERAERLDGHLGIRRLRSVIEFADGRSGSPGESHSRVQIARLRLPKPELQFEITDLDGRTWHSDFGWPKYRQLGEFDGMAKYTRNRYLKGKDVAEVVIEEKLREDAIRLASGFGMVRWISSVAYDLVKLRRLLVAAGLRIE
ncbi:type IV toxin-antitoxin system AbiEi family antitoxin domain-containing protein [Rathayibacter soli]|uniref:type IV toxin-antitoxin system AbiEi family antitoxin domain-containing protein n=1 Tax=Rathayibacter soli TaxID=3144168 RepID=UPI0027E4B13D|nr:hypothetical protein [Glaciibacter superstes]